MTTTPGTPLSAKPITTRWLWVVRMAALACVLLTLGPILALVIFESRAKWPTVTDTRVLLFVLCPVWLGYIWVIVGLHGKTLKQALALAVGSGSLGFLGLSPVMGGLALLATGSEGKGAGWLVIPCAGLTALTQAVLVVSAMKTYYTLPREATDKGTLWRGLGQAVVLFAVSLFLSSNTPLLRDQVSSNQASVAGSLRTINTAETTYSETFKTGYSPSLAALGPPTGGATESASAAGLFDSVLAGGLRSGYKFTYTPGPPDKAGHVKTYTVVARPVEYGRTGRINFFTDESGVIRKTDEDRPATAKDPPIS